MVRVRPLFCGALLDKPDSAIEWGKGFPPPRKRVVLISSLCVQTIVPGPLGLTSAADVSDCTKESAKLQAVSSVLLDR